MKVFEESDAYKKLHILDLDIEKSLKQTQKNLNVPWAPARNVDVVDLSSMPQKQNLNTIQGQMRLVHDLAHIEMQAMELGLRTLTEFPEASQEFKDQLIEVVLDEARHLKMLLECLEDHKTPWGSFPVHLSLWFATSVEDTLLDRILIVHRYLEGSGLDAGDKITKRLWGAGQKNLLQVIRVIVEEEVGHVSFGSRWFKDFCEEQKLNPEQVFKDRMWALHHKLPKRVLKLNKEIRKQAGFTDAELEVLESLMTLKTI